jgi:hypothetical protein
MHAAHVCRLLPFLANCSFEQPGLQLVGSSSHMSKETQEFIQLFSNPQFLQVCMNGT